MPGWNARELAGMEGPARRGAAAALVAATCFGAAAPVSKELLRHSGIAALSFLLYLGAFVALSLVSAMRGPSREARFSRGDIPGLAAVAVAGGVVGPLLLLFGLHRTTGMAGSLLLNLEAPLTVLLAVAFFGEHLSARLLVAAGAVFAGAGFLATDPGRSYATAAGALAISGACLAWAIDNNITQRLSLRDPIRLVQVKTGVAAAGLGVISVATDSRFPPLRFAVVALAVGALGYGLSIVLDVYALRLIGAAREAALFATAPFVGALLAIPLLSERLTAGIGVASALMISGVAAFVWERHEHLHVHAPIEHEHVHEHDEHHHHAHDRAPAASHSHLHWHEPAEHAHPHASDAHHRHSH